MLATPYVAAEHGYIDEVIEPRDTRARLCAALELTRTKRDTKPTQEARKPSACDRPTQGGQDVVGQPAQAVYGPRTPPPSDSPRTWGAG